MDNLKDTEKFVVYEPSQGYDAFDEGAVKQFLKNQEKELTTYTSKLVSWIERRVFNQISKRVNYLLLLTEEGDTQGQLLFWDATEEKWVGTESSELFWDDTNKRFGVSTATPTSELDVGGTGTMTRLLVGGVQEG